MVLKRCIYAIDGTLTDTITQGQNKPWRNGNKAVIPLSLEFDIIRA